ncbi:Hypp5244 [Branchiostoma lanceolatum]|uniref:Hypp5244 protein n=1 Tax=Branchiostoma lanceolatum TaxID=7740 RepID=A0A8K0F1G2_BRALA|nr:Hypp5244 [Branchiostoma lanceolatum]
MIRHFALVLTLTFLVGAVYADLMEKEEMSDNSNNVGDDDMVLLSEKRYSVAHGPNIALGRPAYQKSLDFGGEADRAVDGNRDSNYNHGSCTHTIITEDDPWWYVDLGKTVTVDHVAIVNRLDCCSEKITPFEVHVGGSTTVANNPRCGGHHRFHPTDTEKVVNCTGLRGRYVGIRLPGKKRVLTLCEVEVYAAPNLALGKPTVQSDVGWHGFASRATDGCRDHNYNSRCCSHTPVQSDPWLQVDLGSRRSIQWVVLFNRRDCCSEQLNPFSIHIGDNAHVASNPRCGGHHAIPNDKDKDAINCNGMRGRYVGIRLPGNGRTLQVCELEVYAGTVTKKRTTEVRGIEGQGCGEYKEGESWVSDDEDGQNCICDAGEEVCTKVYCGKDGKEDPIKDQGGLWDCPPEPDDESEESETGLETPDPQQLEEEATDEDLEKRMLVKVLEALENDPRPNE